MKQNHLAQVCLFGGALLTAGVANSAITNGSFETGDFTGWTATDTQSSAFQYMAVRPVGSYAYIGSYSANSFTPNFPVTDGTFSATHGFDGSGGIISIAQDILVDDPDLLFDWGAVIYSYTGTIDREFNVNIRDTGSGALLSGTNIFSAGGLPSIISDTGILSETVDLSAFLGNTVTLEFEWVVPENFAGPAGSFIDNVRLATVPEPGISLFLFSGLAGLMIGKRRKR